MFNEEKQELAGYIDVTDSTGNRKRIEKWETIVKMNFVDGGPKWVSSGNIKLTLNGGHINPTRDPNMFEVAETGELLTKAS